jgi:hypothetical protein
MAIPICIAWGISVVKFKTGSVILGAVAALSLSTSIEFGGLADAADVIQPPAPREASKVPEYVPIVNFSEFVLAMQTFVAQNPADSRVAAEALSAKFATNLEAQKIELHPAAQQGIAVMPVKVQPVAVAHPLQVAAVPPVPDPNAQLPQVEDPVKVVTGYPAEHAETAPHKHKQVKKIASNNRPRLKQFEPAMGLGMVIDSAEDAPPMSSLVPKKR